MTKRRKFSDKFKATVALEALRGDRRHRKVCSLNNAKEEQTENLGAYSVGFKI